ENLPLFSYIERRLEQLDIYINNGMSMEHFDESLITLIQSLNFAPKLFYPIFKSALNNPCRTFFKAVQIFNPKFITLTLNRDILSYSIFIVEFASALFDLIQEWVIYCNFDLSLIEYSNLEEFWKKVSHNNLLLL